MRIRFGIIALSLPLLSALAACQADPGPPLAGDSQSPVSAASRELDALAVESGALPDRQTQQPAGQYSHRYQGGSDRMCVVPDESGQHAFRFGVESRIGQDEYCQGTGHARLAGGRLVFQFEDRGDECLIVAAYEGDRIVMPGSVDLRCALLCSSRSSLAGVVFPRLDEDVDKARKMTDRSGNALCR